MIEQFNTKLITSESVTEGHPDKLADRISDSILDYILKLNPTAKVACETMVTENLVVVSGEISTKINKRNIDNIIRETIKEVGYNIPGTGFSYSDCEIINKLHKQSSDIARGVNKAVDITDDILSNNQLGAGDQGIMFGYATNETPEMIPLTLKYSHLLAKKLTNVRKSGLLNYLKPDGKTQVTIEYKKNTPIRIHTILISTQHIESININTLKQDLIKYVIQPIVDPRLLDNETLIYVNPTGRFVNGGPAADTGLTGRKIIIDTYGGHGLHGGGAFSGKDCSKVDRSGAYAARWIAKNLVAAGFCNKIELQISYGIGMSKPLSINVNTFGTGKYSSDQIINVIKNVFDLRPSSIIEQLKLNEPIFKNTSAYGHFGRSDIIFPWEELNKVEEINRYLTTISVDHPQYKHFAHTFS